MNSRSPGPKPGSAAYRIGSILSRRWLFGASLLTRKPRSAAVDNAAMRRAVMPVWMGASPLVWVVAGLVLFGLLFQLAQGWASVVGDSLWLVGFVLFGVAAATESQRPHAQKGLAIAATACFVLAGLGAAALMGYWILVDAGQIDRKGDLYTIPVVALAVLGLLGRFAAMRNPRR